jgi:translation initiation factor IF-3
VTSVPRLGIAMKGPHRCWSASQALRSIFVNQTAPPQSLRLHYIVAASRKSHVTTRSVRILRTLPRRPDDQPSRINVKYGDDRKPRNHEIPFDFVYLKPEGGKLGDPVLKSMVLQNLDLSRQSLVAITLPDRQSGKGLLHPVCKIVDNQVEQEENRKKEEKAAEVAAAKRREAMGKELEINWAIDHHDLDHYLTRLKGFLMKGIKVDVTLMRKPRKKLPPREKAEEVVQKLHQTIEEAGAKIQRTEGDVLGTMILLVKPKGSKSAPAPAPPSTSVSAFEDASVKPVAAVGSP